MIYNVYILVMDSTKKYDGISVTAFITWQDKALLVQRALVDDFLPGYWEQVGGKVEPNENQEEAVIREVKEEAGLAVKPIRPYNQFEYTHRDDRLMCEHAYICKLIAEPRVLLSSEHKDHQWVTSEELENVHPMTDALRDVVRRGFNNLAKMARMATIARRYLF